MADTETDRDRTEPSERPETERPERPDQQARPNRDGVPEQPRPRGRKPLFGT